nr:fad-dependent monooxygenase cctm [Quercus suber]
MTIFFKRFAALWLALARGRSTGKKLFGMENQDPAHLDLEQLQAEAAASFAEPFRSAWLRMRSERENQDPAHLDLEQLQAEAAASFAEPFRSAWLRIAPGTRVSTNKISVFQPVTLPAQVHGRVTLIGDAAHAMCFHRGQGLNHGINDVATLVSVLSQLVHGGKLQEEAVTEYEAEMIARAGEEVEIGQMNMEMMHDWERLSNSACMQHGGDKNT